MLSTIVASSVEVCYARFGVPLPDLLKYLNLFSNDTVQGSPQSLRAGLQNRAMVQCILDLCETAAGVIVDNGALGSIVAFSDSGFYLDQGPPNIGYARLTWTTRVNLGPKLRFNVVRPEHGARSWYPDPGGALQLSQQTTAFHSVIPVEEAIRLDVEDFNTWGETFYGCMTEFGFALVDADRRALRFNTRENINHLNPTEYLRSRGAECFEISNYTHPPPEHGPLGGIFHLGTSFAGPTVFLPRKSIEDAKAYGSSSTPQTIVAKAALAEALFPLLFRVFQGQFLLAAGAKEGVPAWVTRLAHSPSRAYELVVIPNVMVAGFGFKSWGGVSALAIGSTQDKIAGLSAMAVLYDFPKTRSAVTWQESNGNENSIGYVPLRTDTPYFAGANPFIEVRPKKSEASGTDCTYEKRYIGLPYARFNFAPEIGQDAVPCLKRPRFMLTRVS